MTQYEHCKYHAEEMSEAEKRFYRRMEIAMGREPSETPADVNAQECYPPALESLGICPDCVITFANTASASFLDRAAQVADRKGVDYLDPGPLLVAAWVSGFAIGFSLHGWDNLPNLDNVAGES